MKRLVLVLVGAFALAGTLAAPPAVSATPPSAPVPASLTFRADTTYVHDTLAWIRNNVVGITFGPSKRTGYGQAVIDSIVKGCPECDWYRANLNYSNHQPTSPMTATKANAMKRRGGFCWPWDFDWFSGDSCWNDASSWNWGAVIDAFDDDWHPWNPDERSFVDRIVGCGTGAGTTMTGKAAQKSIVGALASEGWVIKFTGPEEWAVAGIFGCAMSFFH